MFKESVRIDQHTDINSVIRRLSQKAANAGLSSDVLDTVLEQSKIVIEDFFERGSAMINLGSSMSLNQTIKGPGYSVSIQARFGIEESLWERIIRILKG